MTDPTYNPDAIKKLNETMGVETRERSPCGVVIKNKPNDKAYAKNALDVMREDLGKVKK